MVLSVVCVEATSLLSWGMWLCPRHHHYSAVKGAPAGLREGSRPNINSPVFAVSPEAFGACVPPGLQGMLWSRKCEVLKSRSNMSVWLLFLDKLTAQYIVCSFIFQIALPTLTRGAGVLRLHSQCGLWWRCSRPRAASRQTPPQSPLPPPHTVPTHSAAWSPAEPQSWCWALETHRSKTDLGVESGEQCVVCIRCAEGRGDRTGEASAPAAASGGHAFGPRSDSRRGGGQWEGVTAAISHGGIGRASD